MNPKLRKIVEKLKSGYQRNPDGDPEIDLGTLLQFEILRSGEEFNEADVLKAAELVGVPEGSLIEWLEEMASWV